MKEHNILISAEIKAHLPCKALNALYLSDKGNLDGNFDYTRYENIKSFWDYFFYVDMKGTLHND